MIEASTSQNIAKDATIHVQVRAPEQELKPMSADGGARKDSRKDSNSAGGAQPHAATQKPLYVLAPSPDPSPRGDTSHGPAYGESLKREPARGSTLPGTALPGYPPSGRGRRRGEPGGVGDAGILKPETGEGAFAPSPSAPTPWRCLPRSGVMGRG